jgi:hypothetical protein
MSALMLAQLLPSAGYVPARVFLVHRRAVAGASHHGSRQVLLIPVDAVVRSASRESGIPGKGWTVVIKFTIALLSVLAIALLIIAFVRFGPDFATQLRACQTSLYSTDQFRCLTSGSQAATMGFVLYLAGVVAALVAWALGLITTAVHGRWGWFVVVLLLSPLGSLLYGLFGGSTSSATARAARA